MNYLTWLVGLNRSSDDLILCDTLLIVLQIRQSVSNWNNCGILTTQFSLNWTAIDLTLSRMFLGQIDGKCYYCIITPNYWLSPNYWITTAFIFNRNKILFCFHYCWYPTITRFSLPWLLKEVTSNQKNHSSVSGWHCLNLDSRAFYRYR